MPFVSVSYEPGAAFSLLHTSFYLILIATHLGVAGIPILQRELRLRGVPGHSFGNGQNGDWDLGLSDSKIEMEVTLLVIKTRITSQWSL